jgi:hypothetical protein
MEYGLRAGVGRLHPRLDVPDAIDREDHLEGLAASLEHLARFVRRTD